VVLYGTAYWNEVIDFEALARHGMIDRSDLSLFRYADDPAAALALLKSGVTPAIETETPAIAHSRTA
jgi:predicted Rossmann-fold nucleotide-binding protein